MTTTGYENKTVTFIIPTIGRETLARSVYCLFQQTIPNWKAIIVFDGISPTFTTDDNRIKMVTREKLGIDSNNAANVRNYGMNLVDTEWIAFLDDDDTISNNYLEHFYKEIELFPELDTIVFRMYNPDLGILPYLNQITIEFGNIGISFAIKKKIFDEGMVFIPSKCEDFCLLENIRNNGYKIVISPYIKYFVRGDSHVDHCYEEGVRSYINCEKS